MPAVTNEFDKLPIDSIVIERTRRQRKAVDTTGLEDSIKAYGLFHPIIVRPDGVLVAGERRLTACKNLGWTDIPIQYTTDLTPREYRIVELEENIKRKDLTWQEIAQATYEIHQLYSEGDPEWNQTSTAKSLSTVRTVVSNHIKIAEHLNDSRVAECKTLTEALTLVERTESRKRSNDFLFVRNRPLEEPKTDLIEDSIRNSSFLDWAPDYDGPKFNFIHCDFPYGIGVADGPVGRGFEHTFYKDSPEAANQLLECFVTNINKFFDMSGHIMFWYSDKNHSEVMSYLNRVPGVFWLPHPLIWYHAESGITPDYRRRPKHVYDTCMLGMRDRYILKVQSDVFACPTDTSMHPSTKPEAMLNYFMSMLVDTHTTMLDPTCGSGSSLRAAESLGATRVLGFEIDPNYCEGARRQLREARRMRAVKVTTI